MNTLSALANVIRAASLVEQDASIPKADRDKAATIRRACEGLKGAAFALRDYEVGTKQSEAAS